MYTGWVIPFKHGTHIAGPERERQLDQRKRYDSSDNFASLTRFNSSFIEIIDRRFRQRGMVATVFCVVVELLFVYWGFKLAYLSFVPDALGKHDWYAAGLSAVLFGGGSVWLWRFFLGKEFFTHVHYPIRFDRRTRMVHAYRDRQDGGIISVRWEQAFFHIGVSHGEDTEFLRDIRCHVVDADERILDTFAVGHYFDDERKIRSLFEFIRRYMEEGPANVFEDPGGKASKVARDLAVPVRRIDLSVVPSMRNCFNWVVIAMPEYLFGARHLLIPIYAPLIICRWLVFKTCRVPRWPAGIEAESVVSDADPYRLEEPEVHVQWGDR